MLVAQLCLILCDPTDCGPPGFSVLGILQARILEWIAISLSRGSSRPRDRTCISCTADRVFTTGEALLKISISNLQVDIRERGICVLQRGIREVMKTHMHFSLWWKDRNVSTEISTTRLWGGRMSSEKLSTLSPQIQQRNLSPAFHFPTS